MPVDRGESSKTLLPPLPAPAASRGFLLDTLSALGNVSGCQSESVEARRIDLNLDLSEYLRRRGRIR